MPPSIGARARVKKEQKVNKSKASKARSSSSVEDDNVAEANHVWQVPYGATRLTIATYKRYNQVTGKQRDDLSSLFC